MNDVDVCVVAFGSESTIMACIDSVAESIGDAQINLCDNHPDATTLTAISSARATLPVRIRTFHRPDNPGFAVACNQLAAQSTADWLLFLNPDATLLRFPLLEQLAPGVSAPRVVLADGRRQHNYGRRRTLVDEVFRRLQVPPREPHGTGYVSGAALLIRRHEFERLGGFDERFFMYYEDIDLCRRVVETASEVRIVDGFVVRHIGGHSASSDPTAAALRSYRSARAYYQKWSGSTLGIDIVTLVDGALRALAAKLRLPVPGSLAAPSVRDTAWCNLKSHCGRDRGRRC